MQLGIRSLSLQTSDLKEDPTTKEEASIKKEDPLTKEEDPSTPTTSSTGSMMDQEEEITMASLQETLTDSIVKRDPRMMGLSPETDQDSVVVSAAQLREEKEEEVSVLTMDPEMR
jgi:hypothetical protein